MERYMELEERIKNLEKQVNALNTEIRETLSDIQKTLPEKSVRPNNWNRTAWVLALVNLMMAVLLLDNSILFAPLARTFAPYPFLDQWFQSLWVVFAFL